MYRTVQEDWLGERMTSFITGTLSDPAGVSLPASQLTTLTLTLYNLADGAIINSRNGENVLNANGGTVDAEGNLLMELTPNDTVILTAGNRYETHIALFLFTWAAGARTGGHEFEHTVGDLAKVP